MVYVHQVVDPRLGTVTADTLADAQIVVLAGPDVDDNTINRIRALCTAAGSEPLIVIVDHHHNLRFITDAHLAASALVVLARAQWAHRPDTVTMLGNMILRRCAANNTQAPMMVTVDDPTADLRLGVKTASDARQLVEYLTERFAL